MSVWGTLRSSVSRRMWRFDDRTGGTLAKEDRIRGLHEAAIHKAFEYKGISMFRRNSFDGQLLYA